MSKTLIKIEELACIVGVSAQTINLWYKWKKNFPDDELAQLLPNYIQKGVRQTRYWDSDDTWKVLQFRQAVVRGRNGKMGDVTQRRIKKGVNNVKKELT